MQKVKPKKFLGQHFLTDMSVAQRIASTLDDYVGMPVLEVGPGMGVLSQFLLEKGHDLTVVELDRESVAYLERNFPNLEGRIIGEDFLQLDVDSLFEGDYCVIGNYPYNISSQIFFKVLESKDRVKCCSGMLQKEVAERMAAQPGGKDYGALSVAIQYYTEPEIAFIVPPTSFIPAPAVDSAVIVCKRRVKPPVEVCDEALFFRVVKAAFSLRRKMLSNSLKNMGIKAEQVAKWLELAGVDGKRRAETLSLEDFAKLTNSFNEATK